MFRARGHAERHPVCALPDAGGGAPVSVLPGRPAALELVARPGRGLALSVDLLHMPALGFHRGGQGGQRDELAFLGDDCGGELGDDRGGVGRGPDAKTGALKLGAWDAALAVLLNGAEGAAVRSAAQGLDWSRVSCAASESV